jgi:hypothetical protein
MMMAEKVRGKFSLKPGEIDSYQLLKLCCKPASYCLQAEKEGLVPYRISLDRSTVSCGSHYINGAYVLAFPMAPSIKATIIPARRTDPGHGRTHCFVFKV